MLEITPVQVPAPEPVRLVIWDLDETFWAGTVSEDNNIDYIQANHEAVIELARRGIISTICSKNDAANVKRILVAKGIWDYFVLPSIDWSPKGIRIVQLIEDFQLRPSTIRFIDDNPSNLAEARHLVPGLQTAGPEILSDILKDPLFRGKEDLTLSRLQQYKILEKKQSERREAERQGRNRDFLIQSEIEVEIETDIEAHIDRVVELINRTNTMNYTKRRLKDEVDIDNFIQGTRKSTKRVGLVRVRDRYGDYGYCGFFEKAGTDRAAWLEHFCFSCRILGMAVETWLYQMLGRPSLTIVGDVVSNPKSEESIDWITLREARSEIRSPGVPSQRSNGLNIRLIGGCDLDAVAHYLRFRADSVTTQNSRYKRGIMYRQDSSFFALAKMAGNVALLENLGLELEDVADILDLRDPKTERIVVNFSGDLYFPLYEHTATGIRVPLTFDASDRYPKNVLETKDELLHQLAAEGIASGDMGLIRSVLEELRANWRYVGWPAVDAISKSTDAVLSKLAPGHRCVLILPGTRGPDGRTIPARMEYCAKMRELVAKHPAVALAPLDDCITSEREITDPWHYDRRVYIRLARMVEDLLGSPVGSAQES